MTQFNSVAQMKLATLPVGSTASTLGYTTPNDGGQADYLIVASATGTDDGGSFIDLVGVQAELIDEPDASILRYGAFTDGVSDSSPAFVSMHAGRNGVVNLDGVDIVLGTKVDLSSDLILIGGGGSLKCGISTDYILSVTGDASFDDLTIDGDALITNTFALFVGKQPKIKIVKLRGLTGKRAFFVNGQLSFSETFGSDGEAILDGVTSGDGDVETVIQCIGTSDWSEPSGTTTTATVKNCDLKTELFAWTFKGFHDVHQYDNTITESNHEAHEWFSQDTGLVGWTLNVAPNVTIDGGSFTTTIGAQGIISPSDLTEGTVYRLYLDFVAGGTVDVFNGSSSDPQIASNLTTGVHVIEFTCGPKLFLFVKADTAQTVTFEKARIYAESTAQSSATFDTQSFRSHNNKWTGYERGPTAGIDTLTVKIHDETIRDCWNRAIAVDTERFDATTWDSIYPDSKADVHDNKVLDCGRGLFGTCRNMQIKDNFFDNCAAAGAFTSIPSTIRINTNDFGSSGDANIIVDGNEFRRQGDQRCVTVFQGTISLGENKQDSTHATPYIADSGLGGKFKKLRPASDLTVQTASFDLVIGHDLYVVAYSSMASFLEISVPNDSSGSCAGFEFTVVFSDSTGDIRFKALGGFATVNGAALSTVPVGTKIATAICINDDNDFLVTYAGAP